MVQVSVTSSFNQEAIDAILRSPDGPLAEFLGGIGQDIVNIAKILVAVDTGRLRASIVWLLGGTDTGLFVEVGSNVSYAAHQEFGTKFMDGTAYLVPAIRRVLGPVF